MPQPKSKSAAGKLLSLADHRRVSRAAMPVAQQTDAPLEALARGTDPVTSVYTREETARLFQMSTTRLGAWERAGLARPSAEDQGVRRYTFQDLVVLRAARDLSRKGIPLPRIRRALDAVRRSLPTTRSLSEVRILCDGARVIVRDARGTYDPLTGQLLLDFDVQSLRDEVVRSLPERPARTTARTAYDYYLDGCRLDRDAAARGKAEVAYRKAIALDPTLACAYTNLGMLRLDQGDRAEAEALFWRALQIDPTQPEAPYNLGCMRRDAREFDDAIKLLERTLRLDPDFADAYVNLALAFEATGRRTDAALQWRLYLAIAPDGRFAVQARERVGTRD